MEKVKDIMGNTIIKAKEIIGNITKKDNYTIIKLICALVISVALAVRYTITRSNFVVDRIFIVTAVLMFIFIHLIFNIEKIYNFIYKFRYYIALVAMIIITLCEYSGSSIGVYNEVLQGPASDTYFTPVIGKYRSIRSDEWVVNTPIRISQTVDKDSKFAYYNDNLRGTKTDMFSLTCPAVADILVLGKPFDIGFMLFGPSKGLSISWYGRWIALLLISFEFFMVITKKKKLTSLVGALMVLFSAATQWWNMLDYFIWGMLAIVLADKYLRTDKLKTKILCAFGLFISAISYGFIMYPAWQISFMYIYVAVFISLCIRNRKEYKFYKKDAIIIPITLVAVAGMAFRYFNMSSEAIHAILNTDYPGSRFELGGGGKHIVTSYVYSYLFPFVGINNPCEYSGMISFFPIPMVLSVIYLIRNKDRKSHFAFFIPMLIVSTIFAVFSLHETNTTFAKLTFLYMVPGQRLAVVLGFTQIILLIYLVSIVNKDTKTMKASTAKIVALITSIIIYSYSLKTVPDNILAGSSLKSYLCGLILVVFLYLIFTMNIEKNKKSLLIGLAGISLLTGLFVNPVQKGISVLTEKPIAKQVQQIVDENPNENLWFTENTNFYFPDYLLPNRAKVLNSVNIYPNFELYKTVLGEDADNERIRKIYNRYAHVTMEITEDTNSVDLLYEDSIKIKLTPKKVKELGIKYIVALRDLAVFNTDEVKFEQVYNEYDISIYKAIY